MIASAIERRGAAYGLCYNPAGARYILRSMCPALVELAHRRWFGPDVVGLHTLASGSSTGAADIEGKLAVSWSRARVDRRAIQRNLRSGDKNGALGDPYLR